MRFLQINDPHTCDRPPRWRTDSYSQDIKDKLVAAQKLAFDYNVDFVAFTGDLFHNPQPNRVSHNLVNWWMSYLSLFKCHVLIVPGNHDLGPGGLGTLNRQPISILAKLTNVHILTSENPYFMIASDCTVFGIEWQYDIIASFINRLAFAKPTVMILHAAIAVDPNPYYSTIDPRDIAGISKVVCFGHLHPPEVPYQFGGTLFSNPGALSRGSLTPSDLERTPQVALINVNDADVGVEYCQLEAKRPQEIFRETLARAEAAENISIQRFVESLSATVLESVSVEQLAQAAAALTDDPRIRQLTREILMSVE